MKVIEFQSYQISKFCMDQKTKLNYFLFWKKQNFHIACPNATKLQGPCTLSCIELSICITNATSSIATKPFTLFYV